MGEEDQVPKVKLFPARGSNVRTSSNSRSQPASRSEGRPVASVGPRLPPRFGRPRPPSVSTASQAASQRSQASASGKQADFTVTGKADENRRTTSNVLRQPDSTEKPARQQQPKVVATSNSRPKKVFSEQNEKSKDLLHQLLNSGKSKKQQVDEKLSQFEATEAVPSSSSRTDPRRLFGGGRRRKKKPFPRPQAASTEEPREQPQLKSANEKKKDEAVRKNDLARPQPSSAPVLKEPAVKQKEALRLENANEIRRSQGTENNKEVEKSTKSSVSFSVSASKSSLSDSSKEMLQAALNNLHKIAGDKKKEKEASQSAGPATKTEAKVDSSEVVDLRAGAPPSRPRFLNPTSLGEKKTGTPRPSRPQKPQSSARPQRPQGSGRPSRPQGFGRPSRPQGPSRPSRPESSGRSSTRGQVPPQPQNFETEVEEVATTARTISVRTKRPRPSFNRGRPPTRPSSSGPKSERLEIESTSSERPARTERPKRPQRPRPVFSSFITKRSESYITWAEAGQEKEGIKETVCTFPYRRPRTARSQPSGEAGEEGAGDSWNRTGRPFSAGQRSAKRGEEEGNPEERETRQRAAKRRAEAGRGKQNQNKEDSGAKTRRGTSSLSHCILEESGCCNYISDARYSHFV